MTEKMVARICSVDGCMKEQIAKGICPMHRRRMRVHGSFDVVLMNMGVGSTREERFWSLVEKHGNPKGCWEWQGTLLQKSKYGQTSYKGRSWLAHRLSWFLIKGTEPVSDLLHSCDNRKCVNPNHLREGTPLENAADAMERDRIVKGVDVHTAKLDEGKVREIRRRLDRGATTRGLGRDYGVDSKTIRALRDGITWRHVLN